MARRRTDILEGWIQEVADLLDELEMAGPTEFGEEDYERLWDGMMNLMANLQDIEAH